MLVDSTRFELVSSLHSRLMRPLPKPLSQLSVVLGGLEGRIRTDGLSPSCLG